MPWGKYKGWLVRALPDDYLMFLSSTFVMTEEQWKWLRDSLLSEMKFRGMGTEFLKREDAPPLDEAAQQFADRMAEKVRQKKREKKFAPNVRDVSAGRQIVLKD